MTRWAAFAMMGVGRGHEPLFMRDDDALQFSDVRVALMELVLQAFDSDLCLGKLRARRQDAAGEKQQARVPCVSIHLLL